MRASWSSLAGACLAAPLVLASGCATTPIHQKPWIEVQTANFEIASCLSREDTLELARDLELFRSLVQVVTNAESLEAPIPTRVFAFDGTSSFHDFNVRSGVVGYFLPRMRFNYVALHPSRRLGATQILYHAHVHFLLRNHSALQYPRWYDEGLAEFLSTVSVEDDQVVIGAAPHRVGALLHGHWIPLARVMNPSFRGANRRSEAVFYAEAWALVHYLHETADNRGETVSEQMTRYIAALVEGFPQTDAVLAGFGRTPTRLDRELRHYIERGRLQTVGVPLEQLPYDPNASTRPLPPDEIATGLGMLALNLGKPELARSLFEAALAANPRRARAHAGLGRAYESLGRGEEARAHYERALELDPDDAENHLDYAESLFARAASVPDPRARSSLVGKARHHFVRSWKLDPDVPETYAYYGASFLLPGEDPARGVETLEHAHRLLRSDLDIQLLLAQLYVRLGRYPEAAELLGNVIAWSEEETRVEEARALLAEIDAEAPRVGAAAETGPP